MAAHSAMPPRRGEPGERRGPVDRDRAGRNGAEAARSTVPEIRRPLRGRRVSRALCQWPFRDLVLLSGAQDRAHPHPARAGGSGGGEDRAVRQRDRGPTWLDRAAALVGEHARAAPLRRPAPPAPGAGNHRAVAARFDRQGAAARLPPRHGRGRQRARLLEGPEIHRDGRPEGLLRAGLLPARSPSPT